MADLPSHLARTSRADLLLDTLEYNCHTTGSDALWAGVPSLTLASEAMASRVGKSLLQASGETASVVRNLREYVSFAAGIG